MRENTFDIPAVQFYVSNGMTNCTSELYPRAKGELGNDPTKIAVPFEAVDGLVVKEVLDYLENYSCIRSGISISALSVSDSLKGDKVYIPLLFEKIKINTYGFTEFYYMRVDKVIEIYFEEKYNQSNEITKRIYRCFFERYQDGSYEETKKRIKRLEIGK